MSIGLRSARRLLVLGSCALATLVSEVALRNVGGVFHDSFTRPDHIRGWSLRPGFGGWINLENVLWIQINSDGMRDHEHPIVAPPHTVRVAVLGDSYIFGVNVDSARMFTTFLEDQLNGCLTPPAKLEVMNFGVSAYGTAQEWLTYTHHAARYKPDIVVLAVYTQNDIYDNHQSLNAGDAAPRRPYFRRAGQELELDERFRDTLAADARQPWWRDIRIWATGRFRTAQLAYGAWGNLRPLLIGEGWTEEPPAVELDDDAIYLPPAVPEVVDAWQVTEMLMLRFAKDVQGDGAEPWIVTLANGPQLDPDVDRRKQLLARLGVDSLFYPDHRIRDFARAHGIRAIPLAEPMSDYATRHQVYLKGGYRNTVPPGEGHWNEHGNRLGASLVADRMCSESGALRGQRTP